MIDPNPTVDPYFLSGCMRCPLGGTPECKVHRWPKELQLLRMLAIESGLTEELKWGVPTYTFNGNNVAIVSAFNDYAALSFFKGVLLKDAYGILEKPGENTQSARLIKFISTEQIVESEAWLKSYLHEAIEHEKAGTKVEFKKNPEAMPTEFQDFLDENPDLNKAFFALTPGRQRGYILHFSQPKQSATRISRIEKCITKIMVGKGFHDK